MADVFTHRLEASYNGLKPQFNDKIDVPDDRKFIGFDAYQKAMDCLKPGDIAIFATPPAFRWVHFGYAIEKDLNVFMEKPTSVDGPTSRKMLELADESVKKNLKVGVGLMCRHCKARQELFHRIKDGEIGDLHSAAGLSHGRAHRRPVSPSASRPTKRTALADRKVPQLPLGQRRHLQRFLVHNVDEACWMKDAWPVKAQAIGGRHYRGNNVDQNFDSYAVEYTFADGTKFYLDGRYIAGCKDEHATYAHGTKGIAVVSQSGHMPSNARTYKGQLIGQDKRPRKPEPDLGLPRRPSRIPTNWNGTTWSTPSSTTSPTTKCSVAPRPAWSPRWAAWRPTPVRKSPTTTCSTANTTSHPTSTS